MFLHFLTELKDIFPGYQWLDVFIASKDERYNVHIIYPFPISILEPIATALWLMEVPCGIWLLGWSSLPPWLVNGNAVNVNAFTIIDVCL